MTPKHPDILRTQVEYWEGVVLAESEIVRVLDGVIELKHGENLMSTELDSVQQIEIRARLSERFEHLSRALVEIQEFATLAWLLAELRKKGVVA